VVAQRGAAVLDELTLIADKVDAEVSRMRATFATVDTVMERLSQRAKRVYRFVEELDQLRARRADYAAKETFQVHAHDTLLTSDQLVKIDGDQIHVG
jgi:DNA anti-recombination protein RmuC